MRLSAQVIQAAKCPQHYLPNIHCQTTPSSPILISCDQIYIHDCRKLQLHLAMGSTVLILFCGAKYSEFAVESSMVVGAGIGLLPHGVVSNCYAWLVQNQWGSKSREFYASNWLTLSSNSNNSLCPQIQYISTTNLLHTLKVLATNLVSVLPHHPPKIMGHCWSSSSSHVPLSYSQKHAAFGLNGSSPVSMAAFSMLDLPTSQPVITESWSIQISSQNNTSKTKMRSLHVAVFQSQWTMVIFLQTIAYFCVINNTFGDRLSGARSGLPQ